jgi:hypothetical protein
MAKKTKTPRVLLYDIETFPNEAYVWGKYDQNVIAFKKEWEMASFAYKWLGEKEVHQLNEPLLEIRKIAHAAINEFEKAQEIKNKN